MDQLQIIEYKGQRVLTTAYLAKSYGTEVQILTNNFNRNKDRYTEGKHYIALRGDEKRSFLDLHQNDLGSKNATILYLWTEKGAWMHAKSLNTDQAWGACEMLVDEYYRIKDSHLQMEESLKNKVTPLPSKVPVYTPYPEIEQADRLLHMLANHKDLVNQRVSDAVQDQVIELITGRPVKAVAASKPKGRSVKEIANSLGVTFQKAVWVVKKNNLKRPEYGTFHSYDYRGQPKEIFLFNKVGEMELAKLLRGEGMG